MCHFLNHSTLPFNVAWYDSFQAPQGGDIKYRDKYNYIQLQRSDFYFTYVFTQPLDTL